MNIKTHNEAMKKILFACALLPMVAVATVSEMKLDNGMKVIVKEDHRFPVMVSQIWYKVGSSYEHGGITGLSHMLEHMMFKGTENLKPNEFSKIIAAHGGRENAFTGRDYTAYFQRMEKSLFAKSFELEAERMRRLKLDGEEFLKERDVVTEERRLRTDDNPHAATVERFFATAFVNSPYHHPIIGWMNDIRNYQVEDLRAWYQKWYAPNNAILVVAGDVNTEEVFAEAKKHFGNLKPSEVTPPKPQKEIMPLGKRDIEVRLPAKVPYLLMGFPTPTITTAEEKWEPYALDFLSYILDGGRSSRLTANIVRGSKTAVSASAGYDPTDRLQTLFVFDATPADGHTLDEVKAELLTEIDKIKNGVIDPKELERARAQFIASKTFERDSLFYQAMQIGMMETIGLSWKTAESYVDELSQISAEQIRQVAVKYLDESRMITARLIPKVHQPHKPHPIKPSTPAL
jgi:zinc protease